MDRHRHILKKYWKTPVYYVYFMKNFLCCTSFYCIRFHHHFFTFADTLEDIFFDLKYRNILQHSSLCIISGSFSISFPATSDIERYKFFHQHVYYANQLNDEGKIKLILRNRQNRMAIDFKKCFEYLRVYNATLMTFTSQHKFSNLTRFSIIC